MLAREETQTPKRSEVRENPGIFEVAKLLEGYGGYQDCEAEILPAVYGTGCFFILFPRYFPRSLASI